MEAALDIEELFRNHYGKLRQVAYRLTGNASDAEDVLQEAFLRAFRGASGFRGDSTPDTWLYRITVNCAMRYMNKLNKRKGLLISDLAANDGIDEEVMYARLSQLPSMEDEVLARDIRELCIQMFLNCIPRKQRTAFVLRSILGLSVREVSELMDITASDVKTSVFRAKRHLEKYMENRCSLINPESPCRCEFWASYVQSRGKRELIPSQGSSLPDNRQVADRVRRELRTVDRLIRLYESERDGLDYAVWLGKMKAVMESGEMKIFS